MKKDIAQLVNHKTWERVNHNDIPSGYYEKPLHVLKGTSVFKLKLLTNDSPLKYKYCYCVCGDIQTAGVEYL